MKSADYNNQMFKQIEELIKKCDSLSQEMKEERKEFKKEKKILNEKIEKLENENQKLRDDNDRLKNQINNNSNNSSKPPSSDIKKNIPNNREKTNKKKGAQKGHVAHYLSKKEIERKIANKEIEHEIINVGNAQGEFVSKYIIDIQVRTVAKEYRFYKDIKGKYNIPQEFKTDVQYGSELKTMCAMLNTKGIVAINRLTNFVSCISHGLIQILNGSIINFMKELERKSSNIREEIKEKLLNTELMYTDSTTSRCENRNISVRNYSTEEYTLLVPMYGKSKKYIEETGILNRYTGNNENTKHKWSLKLRSLLCSLNEYRKELIKEGKKAIEKEKIEKYSQRYDELLEEGKEENKKVKAKFLRQDEQRLLNRLEKYKENHLMFLYDFNVPFDNNLSERELRHVKTKQKISGHFNSMEGARRYFNIKSIIITLKKQGKNPYKEISNIYKNIPVMV